MIANPYQLQQQQFHGSFYQPHQPQQQKHFFNHNEPKTLKKSSQKWGKGNASIPANLKTIKKPQKPFAKGPKGVYNGPTVHMAQSQQPQHMGSAAHAMRRAPLQPNRQFFVDTNVRKSHSPPQEPRMIPTRPVAPPQRQQQQQRPKQQNTVAYQQLEQPKNTVPTLKSPFFNGKFDIARLVECYANGIFYDA